MAHADRYETHDGPKSSSQPFEKFILQIVREICRFVQKLVVPWYRNWATRVQNRGEKNKKAANFVHFSKGCVFFWPFPRKMGREVGGNGWGYCSGGLGAAAARRYGLVGLVPLCRMV